MTNREDTIRTSPEVPEQLLNDFKTAIQLFNDGKLKGRLSPTVGEAMQLYLVAMYARDPDRLKHIQEHVDPEQLSHLDNPDDYRERVIEYQNELSGTMQEVAHQLQRENPGGPTRLEQYLTLDDTTSKPVQDSSSQLQNSLLKK